MTIRTRPVTAPVISILLVLAVVAAMTTSACVSQPTPTPAAQPTATAPRAATAAPVTPTLATPPGGASTAALTAARKDLATRLGVPEADIRLVSAEPVEWPDTSLGCPRPGMSYAQVITPGFRLVLGAAQATYQYHADHAGHVVTCK